MGKVLKILYRLLAALLCIIILAIVFRGRICNMLINRGESLLADEKYESAEKYFRLVSTIYPNSERCNFNLLVLALKRGEGPSLKHMRDLLASDDEEMVLKVLDLASENRVTELRGDVASLKGSGNARISEAANRTLAILEGYSLDVRCKACGKSFTTWLARDAKMGFKCDYCGRHAAYPVDWFGFRKARCNDCKQTFLYDHGPGDPPPVKCPKCGSSNVGMAHLCHACGHRWGTNAAAFSCPRCHSPKVGAEPITEREAIWYRGRR